MKLTLSVLFVAMLSLPAQNYEPMTGNGRLKWFTQATYGPRSLLVTGPVNAAWRTYKNRPDEWGPHWEGFGKRYGSRLVNNGVSHAVEGSFGAIWNEDPRYFRMGEGSVGKRLGAALKQTWMRRYGDGEYRFGVARVIGVTGGSFSQKLYMPDSVTSNRDCVIRIGNSYTWRFVANLAQEFTPDLMKRFKRK